MFWRGFSIGEPIYTDYSQSFYATMFGAPMVNLAPKLSFPIDEGMTLTVAMTPYTIALGFLLTPSNNLF